MQVKLLQSPLSSLQALIPLNKGFFAIVDRELYAELRRYRWFVIKSSHRFYACRRFTCGGKTVYIRMHNQIAQTPPGMECHHQDHDTFNDTRENLVNLTPFEHRQAHFKSR